MAISDAVSTHVGPSLDEELAPVLAQVSAHLPRSLTLEVLDDVRAAAGRFAPSDDDLRRGGTLDIEERRVPGPQGAPDVPIVICRPAGDAAVRGAVLHIHGGGMVMGTARTGLDVALDWVTELQVVVVSVDYRLAPEHPHPAPVEDCYAALTWLAANAVELGVPPERLVVAGGSAGGGLAAAVALLARDRGGPALLGQILMSPMLDHRSRLPSVLEVDGYAVWDRVSNITGWAALLGEASGGDVSAYASPACAHDLSGLPATYLDVGSAEALRDEGVEYATRLWQAGGAAELHVWSGGFHGFDQLAPAAQLSVSARARRTEWLRRLLERAPGAAGP